jgi:hypothetical protein
MSEFASKADFLAHLSADWKIVHGIWVNVRAYIKTNVIDKMAYFTEEISSYTPVKGIWTTVTVSSAPANATVLVLLSFYGEKSTFADYLYLRTRKYGSGEAYEGVFAAESTAGILTGSGSWNPDSIADGAQTSTTISVSGASVGDSVAIGFYTPAGALISAAVTSSGTVTVTLFNRTGSTLDIGSESLTATVFKTWSHAGYPDIGGTILQKLSADKKYQYHEDHNSAGWNVRTIKQLGYFVFPTPAA